MARKMANSALDKRSYYILGAVTLCFIILLARIFYLQTSDYEKYRKAVVEQMTTRSVIPAGRGDLYDTNGVLLATDVTVYRIFISPKDIQKAKLGEYDENGEELKAPRPNVDTLIAETLSDLLDVDYDSIMEKAAKTNRLDETIKKNVESDDMKKVRSFISENKLENLVHIEATAKRYYCYDDLASNVLGFTSSDNSGLYGLEKQYDEELSGTNGVYITARDTHGGELPNEYETYIEAEDGYSLVTTIDTFIQYELEKQLKATYEDNGADERVCGIVMNVKNGEILAMGQYPNFNSNDPRVLNDFYEAKLEADGLDEDSEEYSSKKVEYLQKMWANKSITETYMPGSTFKVITTSMCLEEKVVEINENFFCSGSFFVPGYSKAIHCHKTTGHGSETFARALQQSCNPVLMTIALRLGSEKFYDYFSAFGFMEKTGIDLPGEANSIFHQKSNFNQVELATASFGQNFTVTPIQQIRGIAAVANGGYLVTPHLVKEMKDSDGKIVYTYDKSDTVRQVISTDVCNTVTEILEDGVSGDGGAKNAYVAGYRVAAKTGTTEKIDKQNALGGTYRVGSCVAYAPADDPQIAVLIVVDEPSKGSVYGSIVAAPYVANVLSNVLPYLGVEAVYTEKELENLTSTLPNYVGWSIEDAVQSLGYKKMEYEVVGDGDKVVGMSPTGGSSVRKDGKVYLYTGEIEPSDMVTVPDVMGKSATVANLMIVNSKLNINITGTTNYENGVGAVVVSQSPAAGESVSKGTVVTVEFRYVDGTD